jgi:hypothetical protein
LIVTSLGKIADGQSKASLLEHFNNNNFDMLFVRQDRAGRKPNLTGTWFMLYNEFNAKDFETSDMHYDHNVLTKSKRSHIKSNNQCRTNQATTKACVKQGTPN